MPPGGGLQQQPLTASNRTGGLLPGDIQAFLLQQADFYFDLDEAAAAHQRFESGSVRGAE